MTSPPTRLALLSVTLAFAQPALTQPAFAQPALTQPAFAQSPRRPAMPTAAAVTRSIW